MDKPRNRIRAAIWLTLLFILCTGRMAAMERSDSVPEVRKVLFIGDSMTGWLAERLEAYGKQNGFEVAAYVWDGSTIDKWADTPRLKRIVEAETPDAIFLSLGLNELFEARPSRFATGVKRITDSFGSVPYLWIGPPSWPGSDKGEILNRWLEEQLPEGSFFRSFELEIPRQGKRNPHPTREGSNRWMDAVAAWLPANAPFRFRSLDAPQGRQYLRGSTFVYRRMKEAL